MTWFRVYRIKDGIMTTVCWTTSIDDAKSMCQDAEGVVWRIEVQEPK